MRHDRVFDRNSSRYEEWFEKHPFVYKCELEALGRLVPAAKRSLEIGVGTGRYAAPLGMTHGVEPSNEMICYARKRGIQVVRGIGEQLPFQSDSFDVVLIVTTICFFENISAALNETARVLRRDGPLIVGMVNRTSPLGQHYQLHKDENVFYREATFYSVEEVVALLQSVGFSRFEFMQTVFHPLDQVTSREAVTEGFGQGSFVAIRAVNSGLIS